MFLFHLTSMRTSSRRAVRPVAVLAVLVFASLVLAAPALASGPPTAQVDAPTDVTVTGATVHATINPHGSGGQGVYWDFPALEPGLADTGPHSLGFSDENDHQVSIRVDPAVFEFLRANERNHWKAYAVNADTWVRPSPTLTVKYGLSVGYSPYGPANTFDVPAQLTLPGPTEPPAATTGPASVVNRGGTWGKEIVVAGKLDLKNQGFPRVGFEIGNSTTYGTLCGAQPSPTTPDGLIPPAQTGSLDTKGCPILHDALKMPGTVLHYRIVADNGSPGGPVYGADATFVVPGGASPAQVISALSRSLAVSGPAAKVSRILANGGYAATFNAPGAGTAQITWSVRSGGKTVTAATGRHTAAGKSTFTVKVKLTRQGRALLTKLKRGQTLKLTAKGTFAPKTGKARAKTKHFSLKG
jgi:hypothetical protein